MSQLVLGLDLGPTSIGWALLDPENKSVIALGSRVFPEGVDRDNRGEEGSKNETRRLARAQRRQQRRTAARIGRMKRQLVDAGLLPQDALLKRQHPNRVRWEREAFKEGDPYELRARGVNEPLQLEQLGRVLLHLAQRRGYRSNRKTDRGNKEAGPVLKGIENLQQQLGAQTLGQFLHSRREADPHEKIRFADGFAYRPNRKMYEDEFDRIWETQHHHHPDVLTEELRLRLRDTLLFQRPLLPPSPGLVGPCELIPHLPRCPKADRRAQKMRLHQEVNNLKVQRGTETERGINEEERQQIVDYLAAAKSRTFEQIRKKLFDEPNQYRFNLEAGGRTKMKGLPADAEFSHKNVLGKKGWKALSEDQRDWLVAASLDADETDPKSLERMRFVLRQANIEPTTDLVNALMDRAESEEGYASYSLHAIKKLLPHVEAGKKLTTRDPDEPSAIREAGFLPPWERIKQTEGVTRLKDPPRLANPIVTAALHEVRRVVNAVLRELVEPVGHTLAKIRIEMAREVRGSKEQREEQSKNNRKREAFRDTAAEAIRKRGERTTASLITRWLLLERQQSGGQVTGQNGSGECLYCGDPISPSRLLAGDADEDHILPYSRSLDNAQTNRVITCVPCNRDKGNQTPREWLAGKDPDRYAAIIQRARSFRLPRKTIENLLAKNVVVDSCIARHLVDTAYLTTQVRAYLETLGAEILCPKGVHTATLRRHWDLNRLIEELPNSPAWAREDSATPPAERLSPGEKNRADHRHHALDAAVIAMTDHATLQKLSAAARLEERTGGRRTAGVVEPPWPDFRDQLADLLADSVVSHKVNRGLAGALHEATIYGPIDEDRERGNDAPSCRGNMVIRKKLEDLTPDMVLNIRDKADREAVLERIKRFVGPVEKRGRKIVLVNGQGDNETTMSEIPREVWQKPLFKPQSAKSKAAGKQPVPIKRVRVLKTDASVTEIRGGTALVKPGNTHHFCLFELPNGKRDAVFVSMLEAKKRVREESKKPPKKRRPIIRREHPTEPNAKFLFSLSKGESVLIEPDGEVPEVYVMVTAQSTTGQMTFWHHAVAVREKALKKARVMPRPNTLNARKVAVTPLGQVRWAND